MTPDIWRMLFFIALGMILRLIWKDIPQLAWHHKPTTDVELRAMTPPGFAWAFYEANK